ncbi:MAG: hypothetical protein WCI72_06135 [archaeon]
MEEIAKTRRVITDGAKIVQLPILEALEIQEKSKIFLGFREVVDMRISSPIGDPIWQYGITTPDTIIYGSNHILFAMNQRTFPLVSDIKSQLSRLPEPLQNPTNGEMRRRLYAETHFDLNEQQFRGYLMSISELESVTVMPNSTIDAFNLEGMNANGLKELIANRNPIVPALFGTTQRAKDYLAKCAVIGQGANPYIQIPDYDDLSLKDREGKFSGSFISLGGYWEMSNAGIYPRPQGIRNPAPFADETNFVCALDSI